MAVCQIQPWSIFGTLIHFVFGFFCLSLAQWYRDQLNFFFPCICFKLWIRIDTWWQYENYGGIFIWICVHAIKWEIGRMNKCLITVFVNDEVDYCWKHSISSDDFSNDQFAQAVTFFIPFSGKRFFLWSCWHVPFFPLFRVMDKGSYNVSEVW